MKHYAAASRRGILALDAKVAAMTSDVTPFDPYRSPSLPEGPYAARPGTGRSQLLTALVIICLVLGVLGLMNSIVGTVGAAGGQQLQKAFQPKLPPNVPSGMQKAQDDLQAEINDVQTKHWLGMAISLAFRFTASLLLVIGGVKALGKKESGRKLLLAACAVALVFELGHTILQTLITTEMMTAFNGYTETVIQSMPDRKNTEGVKSFLRSLPTIMIYAILGGTFVMMLLKCAVYSFGLIYLNKQKIKEQFKPA
jgi:hypothetical protein